MNLFTQMRRKFAMTVGTIIFCLLLVACGSSNTGSTGSPTTGGNNGKGCKKVGVLLPETATSARWDSKDRPLLEQDIPQRLSRATFDSTHAQRNSSTHHTHTHPHP